MNNKEFSSVVEKIYSTALDSSCWIEVSNDIQQLIGGHSVNMAIEDTREDKFNYLYSNGASASDIDFYLRNIVNHDEFTALYDNQSAGFSMLTQNYWSLHQLRELFSYQEFYRKIGYAYFNTCQFYRNGEIRGWLSVARDIHDRPFSSHEQKVMEAILPHLKQAMLINMHLMESSQRTLVCEQSLEHLSAGVVFISSQGRIIYHNKPATRYLSCNHNMTGIHLPAPTANHQLQKAIHLTLMKAGTGEGCVIPFTEDAEQKTVLCFPWKTEFNHQHWLGESAKCILFIISSSQCPKAEQLKSLFDLSEAEVKVLEGVLKGKSAANLAGELFVSVATIRFHIKHLLQKTKSRNQAEMMSKIFRQTTLTIR